MRAYFLDVAGTLTAEPEKGRELLRLTFPIMTLRPLGRAYRLEMQMGTAAPVARSGRSQEVCFESSCGGPPFGLPRTTFRALVPAIRGPVAVRVLRPRLAA